MSVGKKNLKGRGDKEGTKIPWSAVNWSDKKSVSFWTQI